MFDFFTKDRPASVMMLVLGAIYSVGCSDDSSSDESSAATRAAMVETYAEIVLASYEDSLTEATAMDAALLAMTETPTAATQQAAQTAWLASREPYLQTETYRFYDGPIDNAKDGPEGLINAWPLDEAYIDYVVGDLTAGIVNDSMVTIDAATLESLNEEGGEENIATGYHAIEFLLWGQDLSETGPGARPFSDYVSGEGSTAENQDRRALYLMTVSDMLLDHLQFLVDAWDPADASAYRAEFESAESTEALRRILTGMIVLSGFETGGERLQTALDTGDQEDEHSCFSDNTHRDMIQDIQGVLNVWQGSYARLDGTTISGTGVADVVREVDSDLAQELDDQIQESLDLANALVPPFDQELVTKDGQARIQALIAALRAQENLLEEVFQMFELSIPVVE
ncbi:MAG: imelysin family protein [Myxococcota bacterium]